MANFLVCNVPGWALLTVGFLAGLGLAQLLVLTVNIVRKLGS